MVPENGTSEWNAPERNNPASYIRKALSVRRIVKLLSTDLTALHFFDTHYQERPWIPGTFIIFNNGSFIKTTDAWCLAKKDNANIPFASNRNPKLDKNPHITILYDGHSF